MPGDCNALQHTRRAAQRYFWQAARSPLSECQGYTPDNPLDGNPQPHLRAVADLAGLVHSHATPAAPGHVGAQPHQRRGRVQSCSASCEDCAAGSSICCSGCCGTRRAPPSA